MGNYTVDNLDFPRAVCDRCHLIVRNKILKDAILPTVKCYVMIIIANIFFEMIHHVIVKYAKLLEEQFFLKIKRSVVVLLHLHRL